MGARLALGSMIGATLVLIGSSPLDAAVLEQALVTTPEMKAVVEDRPDWCGPRVDVAIRTSEVKWFRGDRVELQRMLGMVRAAMSVECPEAASVRLTGLVDDVFVFGGEASSEADWILVEVPALLTQPYVDDDPPAPEQPVAEQQPVKAPSPGPVSPAATATATTECDALAAHPEDPERPDDVRGVADDALNAEGAVAACRKALDAEPDDPRIKFQLARALLFLGQAEESIELLIAAAEDGHGASLAYLGDITLYGVAGLESDPETAKNLYTRAAEAGFEPARQLAAEIVAGVTADKDPEQETEVEPEVTYAYPAMVKAFLAGNQPQEGMRFGHKVYYAASGLSGVRHECPALVPDGTDWEAAVLSALLQMDFSEMVALGLEYNSGLLDDLMQGGMDDGYAVAVSHGCGAKATKNFVRTAVSYFQGGG